MKAALALPRLSVVSACALAWACTPKQATERPDVATVETAAPAGDDAAAPAPLEGAAWVEANFDKKEVRIAMRDGATLFTTIYTPKRGGPEDDRRYPILLKRTPYSVSPYGEDAYPESIGPSSVLAESGYIFVYQDVRGRFMSDGQFVNMRPHIDEKQGPEDIDEASDTFDTIDWLVREVPNNNGRVGMWGISYPGFYAAAGMIDHHPALTAVSPQAPIADWFFDDFHHHGAFFLPHAFNFLSVFGRVRDGLETQWGERFDHGTPDGYAFFLALGALRHANDRYLEGKIPFWNDIVAHPNRDAFWQARDLLPHLHGAAPAVMTVGGLFDAEDLYGPWHIYASVEEKNPDVFNMIVMGPWAHGGWSRTDGDHLGNVHFGDQHSPWYQREVEKPFFDHFLKDEGEHGLPEALIFETGANQWRRFDQWPPATKDHALYFEADGSLVPTAPTAKQGWESFTSDPAHPVPYTEVMTTGMTREYMTDDQRFASRRPDVLVFQTPPLDEALTLAGPIEADLWVSTSERDADWIVKVIDVFPDAPDAQRPTEQVRPGQDLRGYQMMVRSEVIRGRFREGYDQARPFTPNRPTRVRLPLQDILHTFEPGHRVMVQVQSTWFPLVDRNPQSWVENIFLAEDEDFVAAEHRVYRDAKHPSVVRFGALAPAG